MDALKPLIAILDEYFNKKAPQLPANIKELLVKIAPYLAIIGILITIPGILLLFGLGSVATMVAPMGGARSVAEVPTLWLGIVLLIPVVILEAMAIPGLFARSMKGWSYLFLAQLVGVISNLVQFNFFGFLIGALIGFYILFQIRSHYK